LPSFLYCLQRKPYHLYMDLILSLVLVVILGALIQATTGFGAPIVMLIFFPHWFSFSTSVTLCHLIALASTSYLMFRYRNSIQWRVLFPVLFLSLFVGVFATLLSLSIQSVIMTRILGFFLIALAVFFLVFPSELRIKPSLRNGLLVGMASGVCNGMFGISAPPTALYFMSSLKGKEEYMGTLQAFFFFSNLQSITVRIAKGSMSSGPWSLVLIGWVAILCGTFLGQWIFVRLETPILRKMVYIFVAIAGLWNVIASY